MTILPKDRELIEPSFSPIALKLLNERYLMRDDDGHVCETPKEMLWRVAMAVAQGKEMLAATYYTAMARKDFLPNSPTLMNAGKPGGQLSACYVLDVPDSMDGIFEALKRQALIHKSGGGTGFNFSKLRPKGAIVSTTKGKASGPVSFMELFNTATEKVLQGGMRRGANMGILNVDHPDILDFIDAKAIDGRLSNFNISIGVTDLFMHRVLNDNAEAAAIWRQIVRKARNTGDPGIVFLDTINRDNPTPHLGRLEATNPCGETPLYPNEACNLGSINLSNCVADGEVDYNRLRFTTQIALSFLDRVIDINCYPFPEIKEAVLRTRKVGLGVMGWADMLYKLGIPYDSEEALALAENVMSSIQRRARLCGSIGQDYVHPYPAWRAGSLRQRNATITCIAPTGTISLLADCSSGIEPVYALKHERKALANKDGEEMIFAFTHPEYEKALYDANDHRIADGVFQTAYTISPEAHIRMQAAFQRHTDLAVSKTVNLPSTATADDVERVFLFAWMSGCKGVTVYRDGSKSGQVLQSTDTTHCPECGGVLEHAEGCAICKCCGWSPCGV